MAVDQAGRPLRSFRARVADQTIGEARALRDLAGVTGEEIGERREIRGWPWSADFDARSEVDDLEEAKAAVQWGDWSDWQDAMVVVRPRLLLYLAEVLQALQGRRIDPELLGRVRAHANGWLERQGLGSLRADVTYGMDGRIRVDLGRERHGSPDQIFDPGRSWRPDDIDPVIDPEQAIQDLFRALRARR